MNLGILALTFFVSLPTFADKNSRLARMPAQDQAPYSPTSTPHTVDTDFVQATLNRSIPINGPQCLHGALRAGGYVRGVFMMADHFNHSVIESCFRDLQPHESPQRGDIGQIFGEGEWPLHQFLFLNQRTAFQKINSAMESGYEYTTLDRELLFYRSQHHKIALRIRRIDKNKTETCALLDFEREFNKIYRDEPKFKIVYEDLEQRVKTAAWYERPRLPFRDLLKLEAWARERESSPQRSLGQQFFYNSMANMINAYLSLPGFREEYRDHEDQRNLKTSFENVLIAREQVRPVGEFLVESITQHLESADREYLRRHPNFLQIRFGKQYKWNLEKKRIYDLEIEVQCLRSGAHFRISEKCPQWKERLEKAIRTTFPSHHEGIRAGEPSFLLLANVERQTKEIRLQVSVVSVFHSNSTLTGSTP